MRPEKIRDSNEEFSFYLIWVYFCHRLNHRDLRHCNPQCGWDHTAVCLTFLQLVLLFLQSNFHLSFLPTQELVVSSCEALCDCLEPHCSSHCVNLFQLFKVRMNGIPLCQDEPPKRHVHLLSGCCSSLSATQSTQHGHFKNKLIVSAPEQPGPNDPHSCYIHTLVVLQFEFYLNVSILQLFQTQNHLKKILC